MQLLRSAILFLYLIVTLSIALSNAGAATITASPANVAPGGSVTAQWSAISAPTPRDWVGLFPQVSGNTQFRDWFYVSCTKVPSGAFANGACAFVLPSNTPVGTYQFRLFANDGFTLLATSNNFTVATTPPVRFVDNGDGTISDRQTGLMWEKKVGTFAAFSPNPHNAGNIYDWSSTGTSPDGSVFSDFLTKINRADGVSSDGLTQDRKNYSDWRIPTIAELRGLLLASCPSGSACIDSAFLPIAQSVYWSSTTHADDGNFAWAVDFSGFGATILDKNSTTYVLAVRGGR